MPDHRALLQRQVWQNYNLILKHPAVKDFLEFWQRSLGGRLRAFTVAHTRLFRPAELRARDGVFQLHQLIVQW